MLPVIMLQVFVTLFCNTLIMAIIKQSGKNRVSLYPLDHNHYYERK